MPLWCLGAQRKGMVISMKISKRDAAAFLRACYPGLRLGEQIGEGGTSAVFDLPGSTPPQVVKIMDTRCFPDAEGAGPLAVALREKALAYFRNEIDRMRELSRCRHIMPLISAREYAVPPKRRANPEAYRHACVFLLLLPRLETVTQFVERVELREEDMVQMGIDICAALQYCEEHKLLHRDVKPQNIFVDESGDRPRFILGDFGLCRRLEKLGSTVTRCGTPAFTAPEIELGKPLCGFNSDLFSLGSSLYYLISGGQFPNGCYGEQRRRGARSCQLDPLPKISEPFAEIILKAVQINPSYRQQTAAEMRAGLERLMPDRKTVVVRKQHFLSVKEAMLNGDFTGAIEKAAEGVRCGDEGCRRLLAYCLQHEHSADENVSRYVVKLLDELAFEGDAVAQCLRANLHAQRREWDAFYQNMRESAEAGCVLAQFYYGHALCSGWGGYPRDEKAGTEFVLLSAEAGYLPALQYCGKLLRTTSDARLRARMQALPLSAALLDDAQRLRSDIVKFL